MTQDIKARIYITGPPVARSSNRGSKGPVVLSWRVRGGSGCIAPKSGIWESAVVVEGVEGARLASAAKGVSGLGLGGWLASRTGAAVGAAMDAGPSAWAICMVSAWVIGAEPPVYGVKVIFKKRACVRS